VSCKKRSNYDGNLDLSAEEKKKKKEKKKKDAIFHF